MNIAFFLTPKQEVAYIKHTATVRKALDQFEKNKFTAIPLIDEKGKYIGTLSEGDLLWSLKRFIENNMDTIYDLQVKDIPRRVINESVSINENIESLIHLASKQNFVPVVDDNGIFIGIIKRSDIINYCAKVFQKSENN